MSEKIVLLDEESQTLRLRNGELEKRIEALNLDRGALLSREDELSAEVKEKMALLEDFEDRFNRQYRWEWAEC